MTYEAERRPAVVIDLTDGSERLMKNQAIQTMRLLIAAADSALTSRDALRDGGIARLASRMTELKHRYDISFRDKWIKTAGGSRVKAYFLDRDYVIREGA